MDKFPVSSGMTLEEIDRLLVAWRANLEMCTQNLLALDDLSTYKRLTGGDTLTRPNFTGITAKRVPPALDAIARLFDNLQVLKSVIDRANQLRESMPKVFAAERSRAQLEQLLTGNSIPLPPVETPLAKRGLLTQAEVPAAVSPNFLLDNMTRTFEASKSVIMDVDTVWSNLDPQLNSVTVEAAGLAQTAAAIGESSLPELAAVQARIDSIRREVDTDPLGAGADLRRDVTPLLLCAKERISAVQKDRTRLQTLMSSALSRLEEFRQLRSKSLVAMDACIQQISDCGTLPPQPAESADAELAEWFSSIESTYRAGQSRAAEVGIVRWFDAANSAIATANALLTAAGCQVEELAELRGRFAAQRSRAQAAAARGVSIPTALTKLEIQAAGVLDQNPCPLTSARSAVTAYETALRATIR